MKMRPFYISLLLLTGVISLSSCRKEVHHRFTEEEKAFLPYKLGDSILVSPNNDLLFVTSYEEDEGAGYGFDNEYYDILEAESFTEDRTVALLWRQYKDRGVFEVRLDALIQQKIWSFEYTHSPSKTIIRHENIEFNNRNYIDVIELIDTISDANIFLNSEHGIILLETDTEHHYFELL